MNIIVATNNKGKIREIKKHLENNSLDDKNFNVQSLFDIGYTDDIIEDGTTFFENALIKAKTIAKLHPNTFILADDSGLEVEVLDMRPGIYSARYAGENSTVDMLIAKLLDELGDTPVDKRGARFVCVMVLLTSDGCIHTSRGECYGRIATAPAGNDGFGYDPVFLPADYGYTRSMAEIDIEQKNKISHRAKALNGVVDIVRSIAR